MFLRHCLSDFEVVPFAPVITSITFAFTFHMHWISIVRYSYIRIFLASFLFTFLSALIATSTDMNVACLLSQIMLSGLLLRYFCQFALLVPWYSNLNLPISVHGHTTVGCIIFPLFPYICYSTVQHTLHHISVCTVLFPILDMAIWSVSLSHQTVYSLHLLSVSVCNIFVTWYSVCNTWSCATIISPPASPYRSSPNSHSNVSSPPLSCIYIHY